MDKLIDWFIQSPGNTQFLVGLVIVIICGKVIDAVASAFKRK